MIVAFVPTFFLTIPKVASLPCYIEADLYLISCDTPTPSSSSSSIARDLRRASAVRGVDTAFVEFDLFDGCGETLFSSFRTSTTDQSTDIMIRLNFLPTPLSPLSHLCRSRQSDFGRICLAQIFPWCPHPSPVRLLSSFIYHLLARFLFIQLTDLCFPSLFAQANHSPVA